MYPSAEAPSYGIFIQNHVRKMETEHGIRFELAVSQSRPETTREKISKYASLYGRALAKAPRPYDLVHLHYPSPMFAPLALPLSLGRRKPLVITSHGGDINMPPLTGAKRALVAQILQRAGAVIAVSRDVARMLAGSDERPGSSPSSRHAVLGVPKTGFGVSSERLHVIDMGCDLSLFTFTLGDAKRSAKAALGIDPDRAAILFVGDLIPRKGGDLFLDALAKIPETNASTIVIAGDGPERQKLAGHPIGARAKWLGAIPQAQLAKWFEASDVFVFPTRDEPLGLVTLEAMASGTPVIAARVGGVPELVEHEVNGLLFGVDRVEEIAHQLRRVLSDPELRDRLARRALFTALEHSLERQVSRVVEIYRSLV